MIDLVTFTENNNDTLAWYQGRKVAVLRKDGRVTYYTKGLRTTLTLRIMHEIAEYLRAKVEASYLRTDLDFDRQPGKYAVYLDGKLIADIMDGLIAGTPCIVWKAAISTLSEPVKKTVREFHTTPMYSPKHPDPLNDKTGKLAEKACPTPLVSFSFFNEGHGMAWYKCEIIATISTKGKVKWERGKMDDLRIRDKKDYGTVVHEVHAKAAEVAGASSPEIVYDEDPTTVRVMVEGKLYATIMKGDGLIYWACPKEMLRKEFIAKVEGFVKKRSAPPYLQVYHRATIYISDHIDAYRGTFDDPQTVIQRFWEREGTGRMWKLAKEWADEFVKESKSRDWTDVIIEEEANIFFDKKNKLREVKMAFRVTEDGTVKNILVCDAKTYAVLGEFSSRAEATDYMEKENLYSPKPW